MNGKKEFQQRLQKIEELVRDIETAADPKIRSGAVELMQSLMELHGAAFERVLEIVFESGPHGEAIIDDLARDETVESLLLLYGLHPLDLETRVAAALEKVRPSLRSHSAEVELLGINDGAVRLRLESSGQGCGSTASKLKAEIEEAIYQAAPDMTALEVEVIEPEKPMVLVQLKREGKTADKTSLPVTGPVAEKDTVVGV
jgi:Fe-S cluster biogenesis protein NfuA